jgi:hypothetical protein
MHGSNAQANAPSGATKKRGEKSIKTEIIFKTFTQKKLIQLCALNLFIFRFFLYGFVPYRTKIFHGALFFK